MTLLAVPCIERTGHGFTTTHTYTEWAAQAIQDDDTARQVAEQMLAGSDPYEWNEDEPEFYEIFTVTDRRALIAQLAEEHHAEQTDRSSAVPAAAERPT